MGIDLTLSEVHGIVLSDETVKQIADRFDIEYDEENTWEADEEINDNLPDGLRLDRAEDAMSGAVSIPYLAITRLTEDYDAKSMDAGIYALSDKPFRLKPEEADAIQVVLVGTDGEGAEVQKFVAFSIT